MGVVAIPWSGGASRRRAGRSLRAAAVLSAVILVGCGSGPPATPAFTTDPGRPVATAGPSHTAPGSTEGDVAITAVTYSDDPASPFFAVVELGPNDADISRLDVYRGADGRLSNVVAYGPEDRPAVITFDAEGRPLRVDASGYVADFTYPASDVEVVVTAMDGSVVRNRGPLDLGATIPVPRTPNARLASLMEEPPAPGMVRWPATFYSFSVFKLEVVRKGTNRGIAVDHVLFPDASCTPSAGMSCTAWIRWVKPEPLSEWRTEHPAPWLYVTTFASTKGEPGSDQPVWRTRADCDAYTPLVDTAVSGLGLVVYGIGAYRAVIGAATVVAAAPRLALGLAAVAGAVRAWQKWGPSSKPDCNRVPNLQLIEDAFFDQRSTQTATITIAASGDCVRHPTSGWRIKEPKKKTVTFEPFNPVHRSAFGAVPGDEPVAKLRSAGTITFQAGDCAVVMEGEFDIAAQAAAAGMSKANAAAFAKLVTENRIELELKKTGLEPTAPVGVTGTFTYTIELPGTMLWSIHEGVGEGVFGVSPDPMPPEWADCRMISTMKGTLQGTLTSAGEYRAKGLATVSAVGSTPGCADTNANLEVGKPQTWKKIAWKAVGSEATLKGAFEIPGSDESSPMSWIFKVNKTVDGE